MQSLLTHQQISDEEKLRFLGISDQQLKDVIAAIHAYRNHDQSSDTDPVKILMSHLQSIGVETHIISVLDIAMSGSE
jgi:hypothetical protein